jgi:acid phosphatase type 7
MRRRVAVAVCAALAMSMFAGARGPAVAAGDPVVAAAGDIACAPPARRGSSSCHHRETSDLLVAGDYDAVLPLGDLQYECGQASAYQSVYGPTWGRVKAVTHPAVGDNEYSGSGCSTSGASGYFGYFGAAASPRQPSCRSACQGWYSYDLGTWHVVVLNSECGKVGGCTASSAQGRWLASDLAAHDNRCTLAYWHRPRWTDNGTVSSSSSYFVQALYNAGAEVILAGHEHHYGRFAPQTPSGVADQARGIRQFIVGTGGKNRHGLNSQAPRNSQARSAGAFGILTLTLHPNSYDWRFIPEPGKSFTDSGTQACH